MSLLLTQITVTVDGKETVRNVSCEVGAGEIVLLVGPNGSGKSTLSNAIMGHPQYVITSGAVTLDGVDITAMPVYEKARAGLFLSQQHIPKIAGLSLVTFLHTVHGMQTGAQVDILEYYLQVRERMNELGLDPDILDRPLTAGLSGGQKKLSEIVQLAVCKPKYAILDEIDSGVDVDALKDVFRVVSVLAKQGTGFLLVSHHPSVLNYLTPTAVHLMVGGSMVRSGGVELLRAIQRDGFCTVMECPLVSDCKTNG
jgi:Fe-S cluster assembly ATP-binding protein